MPEHYTKNTVSATVWCNVCVRATEHRVDDGRRGPCMVCLGKLEAEADSSTALRNDKLAPEPRPAQGDLFR